MDFHHADSVGDAGECAEPDGNVVVMINVINRPHDKGDDDYPFEPHGVLGVDVPGEHTCGDYGNPGYGVCGDGGNGEHRLNRNKRDFDSGCAFPFCNDDVSCNAYKARNGSAVSSEKEMGKGVEPELQSLKNDVSVFIFYKTDKHHYGAADEGNNVSQNDIYFHGLYLFCGNGFFTFFSDLNDAYGGGNNGERIECRGNKVEVIGVINEPEAESENHYVFEFDNVFTVKNPGEKGSRKYREPGDGVESYGSDGKSDGKSNKKKL